MTSSLLSLVLALALEGAPVGTTRLPEDARLAPVRPRIQALVDRTASAGLPADLVVTKVREGLAKGVDPVRIEQAAVRLAESLEVARRFAAERRPGATPSVALVRALAQAKMAGVELGATAPVVAPGTPDASAARAVDVLADLSRRGYPGERAAGIVREVLSRDAVALDRLPAALETLRQTQALTQVEAVDALSRGLAGSKSLQGAVARTVDDEQRRGGGRGNRGRGEAARDLAPGKSDLAPGHLKPGAGPGAGVMRGRKDK